MATTRRVCGICPAGSAVSTSAPGKQLWKFNLVPQPGEYGADTWKNGSKIGTPGVGKNDAWAPYSADPALGLVYIPVGMPLSDEYGGHRPGDNLYGNSIVALDVKTGKQQWHFQIVRHDIWDYDTPMAPNLLDITVNGKRRQVIAQTTKQGWIYTFDRVTGAPIWPIVETPVLQSDVPGEKTSQTQPIPSKPAPYSQQGLEEDDLIDYTPEIKAAALHLAQPVPDGSVLHSAVGDRRHEQVPLLVVRARRVRRRQHRRRRRGRSGGGAHVRRLAVRSQHDRSRQGPVFRASLHAGGCQRSQDSCGRIGAPAPPPGYVPRAAGGGRGGGGGGRGGGGAALTSYKDAQPGTTNIAGVSILKPRELGGITAYNMNSGDKAWWIPNGGRMGVPTVNEKNPDAALFANVKLPPGSTGRGQPQVINTKTLVIYGTGRGGGGGLPPQLYAVDKATGKQVAAVSIPSLTSAVPMTFMHNGKQYIVFATGAGANTALIALTLPN